MCVCAEIVCPTKLYRGDSHPQKVCNIGHQEPKIKTNKKSDLCSLSLILNHLAGSFGLFIQNSMYFHFSCFTTTTLNLTLY